MFNNSSNKIEKEFENLRNELLDLTLRNQLLNFKLRAKTIAIENQYPTSIVQNLILQRNKMYFDAGKKEESEKKSRIWVFNPISKFSDSDKTLKVNLTPNELQKRLFYINNQAKTMLQEQGYNILYLAVGFLEWSDNKKPNQKNLAPLILIPVSIERKKIGNSFELTYTGEEIQTNISLKAKLKENGINLPDFEFKKYGEVFDHYIKDVKNAVAPMKHWSVNSNIALGFFSFTKFVMYNDLNPESWDVNVDLTKKKLIQAIFNPEINNVKSFDEQDIDTQLDYGSMYQVLDADSSQIAVIEDVKAGRNLVVEGPPGTGKSQTIVNLIAELLAEGKTVLFVSEKMAALEVVKERLQSVGLGKFVLELHSHKTRRRKLLKELEKAVNVRHESDLNMEPTIRKLETLKKELDAYPEIVHQRYYGVNLSPFELYGIKEDAEVHFVKKDKMLPLVKFSEPELITIKDLDDMVFALENIAELFQTISSENPWSKCAPKSLLPADLREIEILIMETLQDLDEFMMERQWIDENLGVKTVDSLNDFSKIINAFKTIESKSLNLIDGSIFSSNVWSLGNNDPFILIENLENYQRLSGILNNFNDNIYHADIDGLIFEVQKVANKKFRLFKNNKSHEIVEKYYKTPIPDTNQIIRDLSTVKLAINSKKLLESRESLARQYFGFAWSLQANVNDLKEIAQWMKQFCALVDEGIFSNKTINILSKDLFNFNLKDNISNYIKLGENFKNKLSKLIQKLNPQSRLIFNRDIGDVSINQWKSQLTAWRGQLSSLHLWSQYINTKQSLKGTYSEPFVDIIERRNIKKEDVKSLVYGNFADALLNVMFINNHELATFIGELHENKIKEFKQLDKQILELNRKRIFNKLNSNIPDIFGGSPNNEAQILAGEFTRKSGHLPVRKLLQKAGGIIKQIKPVFMMSPLSIAQYLDPTNEKLQFDVVIFDEASQVKPQDALGAFMRANTAVVMGDTQQLPPTSFFEQMSDGESYEEEATSLDMESILHLCKLSFPVKMLKWHYRSRHESLIAVSNTQFYDDELLVYPSPSHNDPELGLKLHYNPNTYYDRGSSSANKGEAKDVVKAIFEHFDKYGDTKSLGVGTFSVAQKNAILEELELQRKQRPELEPLFDENKEERFFVKNLETIQGDERDVILISVGYGFDIDGKMSLNFGPLNQQGGERRLNVLITRAREKCVVFSNFKATDMHLTENPPYGVKSLREFLYYADHLIDGNKLKKSFKNQKFEDAIAKFLEEKGYTVDRQIGCAGFRVDLAIVDDKNPGQYFLGITTDGEMYASSKVARDRNRLREQVLEGLGWNIYHLWSTDWYRNRELGREKLLKAIEEAKLKQNETQKIKQKEAEQRKIEVEKLKEEYNKSIEEAAIVDNENSNEETDEENNDDVNVASDKDNSHSDDDVSVFVGGVAVDDGDSQSFVDDVEFGGSDSSLDDNVDVSVEDGGSRVSDGFDVSVEDGGSRVSDGFDVSVEDGGSRVSDGFDVSVEDGGSRVSDGFDVSVEDGGSRVSDGFDVSVEDGGSRVSDGFDVDDEDLEPVVNVEDIKDEFFDEVSDDDFKSNKEDFNVTFKGNLSDEFKEYKSSFKKSDKNKNSEANDSFDGVDGLGEAVDWGDKGSDSFDGVDGLGEAVDWGDKGSDSFDGVDGLGEAVDWGDKGDDSIGDVDDPVETVNLDDKANDELFTDVSQNGNKVNSSSNNKREHKSFFDSIIDSFKGETKLNVTGAKTYKDNLEEVYIPEVEVNEKPVKKHVKKKNVVDAVVHDSDSNGNVYDKDDDVKQMANKLVDDVFDSILGTRINKKTVNKDEYSSVNLHKNNPDDEIKMGNRKVNKTVKDKSTYSNVNSDDLSKTRNSINESNKNSYDKTISNSYNEFKVNDNKKEQTFLDNEKELRDEYFADEKHLDANYQEEKLAEKADEINYEDNVLNKEKADNSDYAANISNENESIPDQSEEELVESIKNEIENDTEITRINKSDKIKPEPKIMNYEVTENLNIISEELYNKSSEDIAKVVNKIVEIEGPIHINEVIKRIRENSDIKRAGAKLKKVVRDAIDVSEKSGKIIKANDFLFNSLDENIAIRKRVKPNIDLISDEEIEMNIKYILTKNNSFNVIKIAKEASNNFGFKSVSKKTAGKINNVLDSMIVEGKVILEDNFVKLN